MKARLYITITMFLLFYMVGGAFAQEWYPANVGFKAWDAEFNDVFFTDEQNGWIIGDQGMIAHTETGSGWNEQVSGVSTDLNGVYFGNTLEGWVVGNIGVILHTTNGGQTWTSQQIDAQETLYDVGFVTNLEGWIVGSNGTILFTDDGGNTWKNSNYGTDDLYALHFYSPDNGWAVGEKGTVLYWNGSKWSKENTFANVSLLGVYAVKYDNVWAVGENGIILHKIGSSWITTGAEGVTTTLRSVFFPLNQYGWIVGDYGTILYTSDSGSSWKKQQTVPVTSHLNGVFAVNSVNVWAVGDNGTIIQSTDGGASWVATPSYGSFRDVCFAKTEPSKGWAVGDNGVILHTEDGGTTWLEQQSQTKSKLYSVYFLDDNNGWVVGEGNTIIRTRDGSNWEIVMSNPQGRLLRSVYFTDSNHGWVVGDFGTIYYWNGSRWDSRNWNTTKNLYGVQFIDSSMGWVVGDGGILINTRDGGLTWERIPTNTDIRLTNLCFINAETGWIVGDQGTILYKTKNNITRQNSGTLNTLYDVDFINDTEGWIAGAGSLRNTLLHTTNGGNSWEVGTVPYAKSTLYGLDFTSSSSGVVIGLGGSIVQYTSNIPTLKFELLSPYGDIYTLTPTFKWKTSRPELTHTIYISKYDNPFQDTFAIKIPVVGNTSYTLPKNIPLSPSTYYWGIEVSDGTRSRPDEILRFNTWPPSEIVVVSPSGYIKDSKPTFEWHWMENVSYTLYIDTDGNPFDGKSFEVGRVLSYKISNSDTWQDLPEGVYSWGVSGNDDGQITKSSVMNFTVDLSPPKGTVLINDGSRATNSLIVTLKLSASDPLSNGTGNGCGVTQMQLSSDGSTWTDPEAFIPDTMTKTWDLSKYGGDNKDGLKTVFVHYKDALDHWSDPIKTEIYVDKTPPTGTISINNGAEVTGVYNVTLSLSAADVGSGMEPDGIMYLSNDGSTWSDPLPYGTTRQWDLRYIGGSEFDGTKTVYVKYKDPAGNLMTIPATAIITLDRTGPKGTIVINDGATETNSLIVTLALSATDVNGVKEMHFSNGNNVWSDPESYNTKKENWDLSKYGGNSTDGSKKVFVRFIDTVGNETQPSLEASILYKSKITISSLAISAPKVEGKVKNGDTVQVSGKTEQDVEIVQKELLDENDKPINFGLAGIVYEKRTGLISGSFTLGELTAKTIKLKLSVKDSLGNQTNATSNILTVDNNPPYNTSVALDREGVANSKNMTLDLSATDAAEMYVNGDVSTVYEVENGLKNWTPFKNTLKIKVTDSDGTKVVKVRFRDDMGNESAEVSDSVVLDATPPKGTILINNGEEISGELTVTLKLSATDTNGVLSYQLSNDSKTWSEPLAYPKGSQDFEVKGWDLKQYGGTGDDGLKTVYVRYMDNPGNWSNPVSDNINVDASPPTISVQLVENKREAMNPVTVTAIIKDNIKVADAFLYYRKMGPNEYTKVPMIKLSGDYYTAQILGTEVTQAGVEYYLSASDGLSTSTHPYKDAPIKPNSFTVVDTTPPNIQHELIAEISVKNVPKITAKITDAVGVDHVSLYYKPQLEKNYTKVDMTAETGSTSTDGTYFASIPALDLPGAIEYYIEAIDTSANMRTSPINGSRQPYVLSFVDFESPIISHTPIKDGQEAGKSVVIGATITDNVGVDSVTFKYSPPGKTEFIEVTMTKVGNYYSAEIPGSVLIPGKVNYVIAASDVSKQSTDATVSYTFSVVDTTPPIIEITSAPSKEEVNKDISIQVKVTDNVGVASVNLYYKNVTDTKFNSLIMKSAGNRYSATIPGQKQTGEVKYYILAKDSQGISATEPLVDPENVPHSIVIFDLSAPVIQHSSIVAAQEAGLPVTVTATVTDDVQVMDVTLHYRSAGQDSFKIAPMVETTTKSVYTGEIPASQVVPTGVEYYIKALDNSGNVTTHPAVNPDTLPHSFRVVDTLPPEIIYDPSNLTKVLITDPIVITTEVTDRTGIKEVKVFYKFEGDKDFGFFTCKDIGNNRYTTILPSPFMKTNVYYYFEATDNSGNVSTSPKQDPKTQPYLVFVDDPFPPLPPTKLAAIPAPGGKVSLTWELSKSSDVGKYNIYTDNGSGTIDYSTVYDSVDASKNSWESTALGEGTYKFSVRAVDKSGNEETNTAFVEVKADSVKPDKPTNITATSVAGGRIELTWKLSLSRDATVYNIYWDNAQASINYSTPLARVNDPETKWVSDKLRDGIVYRFVVRCQDQAGNEEENTDIASARADATPPSVVTRLSSPSHKLDTWSDQTKITVTWSPSEDVISGLGGYSIIWDSDPKTLPDETIDVKDPSVTELTYEPTELQKQGYAKVYFHIRPVDKAGNWSSEASHIGAFLIDNQPPQPPTSLASSPQPNGKIKVSWKASESDDVLKYNIYWDSGTGTGVDYSKTIAVVTADQSANYEWTSSALTDGKMYEFSVRAEDHAGNEEKNTKTSTSVADDQPPSIVHKPISALLEQEIMSVDIHATVDDAGGLDTVTLYYRKHGNSTYIPMDMVKEPANVYRSEIPSSVFSSAGVDYYISATDMAGNMATYPVTTIVIVRSLLVPIDPTKENEILLGDGSSIYFPAGAVSPGTNVSITIPSIIPEPQAGLKKNVISREFSLDKELLKPINVTLKYSDAKIAGEDESKLAMYLWDGTRWNYLAVVNARDNSVMVSTMKTGIFSIIGDYEPPAITDVLPTGYAEPDDLITAKLEDNGSGIDAKKIEVTLNGEKITVTGSSFQGNELSIVSPKKFSLGHYSLQISMKDMVGNQATATSAFDVTGKLTMINVYCYPNPFDPKIGANFAYTLTESADSVNIRIFGMDGRLVKKIEGTTTIGENVVQWDCNDEAGEQVLSSIFICQIEAKSSRTKVSQTIKIAGW